MTETYRKDLRHLTWEQIYQRQQQRSALLPEWFDALRLAPGSRVLDIGAGPGYVSMQAAAWVGQTGLVTAVDTSAEALAFLEELQRAAGITQIRRMVADATALTEAEAGAQAGGSVGQRGTFAPPGWAGCSGGVSPRGSVPVRAPPGAPNRSGGG